MFLPDSRRVRIRLTAPVEETGRASPLDGVVLLAGCNKTTPALLMGAASCDVPTVLVSGGPMLNGWFRGRTLGPGTDVFRLEEDYRTGRMDKSGLDAAEVAMSRSAGSCIAMGTASSMALIAEAMGAALRMNGAIPAADSRHAVLAGQAGRAAVGLVLSDTRISRILSREAFGERGGPTGAIGGWSTNAVLHLLALAGRLGVPFRLDDRGRLGREVRCLVDLKPSGRFLMEDFSHAGGLPVVMSRLAYRLHPDAATVEGRSPSERVAAAECYDDEVIRTVTNPVTPAGGLVVLQRSLAPDGAVMKPSAASLHLLSHRGRAVVFRDAKDFRARIDDPDLDVDVTPVLVLLNSGPQVHPGIREVSSMAIPKKLLAQGVIDLVRMSDARMSGTAYSSVVLHVAPEPAVGGPLGFIRTGDLIVLDITAGRLDVELSEVELARRRAAWERPPPAHVHGYGRLFLDHVQQADKGADFDTLVGHSGTTPSNASF